MLLRWKKKKGVSYQVQWSTNVKFKKAHKKKVKKNYYVISNKKIGKNYYVRVRCVKKKMEWFIMEMEQGEKSIHVTI